ncbi:MAG: ribosome silencing factor [Bacteroidota bacterium]|nr:ribosome silencing factor [Bacteroidota bacterium]
MIKKATEKSETAMLADIVINAIYEKKGENVVKIDMRPINSPIADFFIVCQGSNRTQVEAIVDSIYEQVKKAIGIYPSHVEGRENAEWMLVDYFDVVVHVFQPETRGFYKLESLWADADITEVPAPAPVLKTQKVSSKKAATSVNKSNKTNL